MSPLAGFVIGILVGAFVGVAVMCIVIVGKASDTAEDTPA